MKHAVSLPPLTGLMEDPGVGVTDDARMLAVYLRAGHTLPPLPMSIGDPYLLGGSLPPPLARYERAAPRYLGGYSRTPAGLPEARQLIAAITADKQGLDRGMVGRHFDVHLTSGTGTRGIMGDFGRYMLDVLPADSRTPVVLCPAPTWDYAGVFEPLGYKMVFWPLRPENAWMPDVNDIRKAAVAVKTNPSLRLSLVVVNAQHNPTGRSWTDTVLRELFGVATEHGAGILLDDPYNFVVTDAVERVSAPAVLFNYFESHGLSPEEQHMWCRVESFGKVFSCNDWGIGTVMAHPAVLNKLAAYTFQWAFPRAGNRQWAMARWLADPACDQYLARQRASLRRKRTVWTKTLRELGWSQELTVVGEATPYFLMAVPPDAAVQPDGIARWRQYVLDKTGILLSYASIEQAGTAADMPFLRAYLGGGERVVAEAAARLKAADIRYQSGSVVGVRRRSALPRSGKK